MSKSERIRAADMVAVVRLANECRELGDDAAAWQMRLVEGLLSLTGGMIAGVGPTPSHRAGQLSHLQHWVAQQMGGGWPSAAVKARQQALHSDPAAIREHPGVACFWASTEPTLSLTRREMIPDREWERSPFVNELLRPDGMDDGLISRTEVAAVGGGYVIAVVRAKGDRPFAVTAARVTAVVLRELTPYLGRELLLTTQPNLHGLTPRLRQVLECLLDGDGEKQAAARLSLHRTTVHDHVKRLYRHFGVNSRAELLAYFLRRHRRR